MVKKRNNMKGLFAISKKIAPVTAMAQFRGFFSSYLIYGLFIIKMRYLQAI